MSGVLNGVYVDGNWVPIVWIGPVRRERSISNIKFGKKFLTRSKRRRELEALEEKYKKR